MGIVGSYQYPTMESVIYGKPAAEALREEAERLGAKRVYLIVSRTLNSTTDEIEKIRAALGERHAETFDGVRSIRHARWWCGSQSRQRTPRPTWSLPSAAARWSMRRRSC